MDHCMEIRVLNCANLEGILKFGLALIMPKNCIHATKHNTNCKFQRKNILLTMALFSMLGHKMCYLVKRI